MISRNLLRGWIWIAFALLCYGTLFAVSDSFVDTKMIPKWCWFLGGASVIIITLEILGFRSKRNNDIRWESLFFILLTFCLAQAVYGILQFVHFLPTYGDYKAVGSFENPAGFIACLCAGIPVGFYFLWDGRKYVKCYAIVVIVIICVAVILSFSRTGIFSLILVAMFACFDQTKFKYKVKVGIGFALLLLIISPILYFVKKDSADGRLLIWRCSLEMIKDKPILGHGPGGFTANYMNYQAEYFKQNPSSKYAILADNIHHPFNEYILLVTNYGLVGFVLFLALLYWIWIEYRKKYKDDAAVRISGWCLCSILFFAFFSYPFSYPFVWIVMLMSIMIIGKGKYLSNRIVRIVLILIASLIFVWALRDMYYQLRWREISRDSIKNNVVKVLDEYAYLHRKFAYSRHFLYFYAYELRDIERYAESLAIAKECSAVWADYYVQLMIADNYYQLQQYDEATQHFEYAAAMCPVRFVPLYRLAKIYIEMGRTEEAKVLARQIVDKEIKIPSFAITTMKYQMQQFITNKTNNND